MKLYVENEKEKGTKEIDKTLKRSAKIESILFCKDLALVDALIKDF